MKVAIFHDFFSSAGGGEKVVLAMADVLHADIYTSDLSVPPWFIGERTVKKIGNISNHSFFRQMGSMMEFYRANISDQYDMFIFSGNWAHHASKNHTPSLFYCHTPVRALYDLYPVFKQRLPICAQPVYATWASMMRMWDQRSIKRVCRIVANSQTVQKRIQHYYLREAEVIYPPVDTSQYTCKKFGDFWLSVNRLYPEKRIELQIQAFSHMKDQNLIIVGGISNGDHAAPYARYIQTLAEDLDNVQILGQVTDIELRDLYARCRGLICTAIEEDFGITPLEAMASGKPVIAVAEGGFLETVTDECGIFIQPREQDIISAVREISSNPERYKGFCRKQALKYDIAVFNNKIRDTVHNTYVEYHVGTGKY